MRVSKDKLNQIKKKYNVDTLWSWSRINSFHSDPYSYYLNYVLHKPQTIKDSIYGFEGGECHDIIERFYNNEIKYEDMIGEYEKVLLDIESKKLKYNKTDADKNKAIATKYENSIRHFFNNYKPFVSGDIKTEMFTTIKVGGNIFQGYIDFLRKYKDENGVNNFQILDWKTSTIYKGEKKENEAGQLLLYALAIHQKGVPYENIHCAWNFLKYVEVESCLASKDKKTGKYKTKSKECVRATWVKESEANIKSWIKRWYKQENGEDIDELTLVDMVTTAIENNNLDNLPEEVKNKFTLHDCYVNIEVSEDIINNLCKGIIQRIDEINKKVDETNKLMEMRDDFEPNSEEWENIDEEIDKIWWKDVTKQDEYFFYNLCGYSRKDHKPWDTYLKEKEIGINKEHKWENEIKNNNKEEELSKEDLDWWNSL